MNDKTFRPRTYGFTELAQLYFPCHTPRAASRSLGHWLRCNPRLRHLMRDGHKGRRQSLTPRQVALIVSELGEP